MFTSKEKKNHEVTKRGDSSKFTRENSFTLFFSSSYSQLAMYSISCDGDRQARGNPNAIRIEAPLVQEDEHTTSRQNNTQLTCRPSSPFSVHLTKRSVHAMRPSHPLLGKKPSRPSQRFDDIRRPKVERTAWAQNMGVRSKGLWLLCIDA